MLLLLLLLLLLRLLLLLLLLSLPLILLLLFSQISHSSNCRVWRSVGSLPDVQWRFTSEQSKSVWSGLVKASCFLENTYFITAELNFDQPVLCVCVWGMAVGANMHTHKTPWAVGGDKHRQLEHFQHKRAQESSPFPRRVFKSAVWGSAWAGSWKMRLCSEVQ
jgi:hypothetical protein